MFFLVSKDEINTYEIEFLKETKSAIGFNKTAFYVNAKSNKRLKESLNWNKCIFNPLDSLWIQVPSQELP